VLFFEQKITSLNVSDRNAENAEALFLEKLINDHLDCSNLSKNPTDGTDGRRNWTILQTS